MGKKIKKFFFSLLTTVFVVGCFIVFEEELIEFKYFLWSSFSKQYEEDKNLVRPYFDEAFYLSKYKGEVQKSGLEALDHFLKKGWHSNNWRNHTDPNPWFNTTLHKERLWDKSSKGFFSFFKIKHHPFINFLKQPKLGNHTNTISLYAKADELGRAWLAVEGLMRLNKHGVELHLPHDLVSQDLIRFEPQIKRGLKVVHDNAGNKSFYHSDFIKNPSKYNLSDLKSHPKVVGHEPVTYVKQDFEYLMHRLYNYTRWYGVGRINPTMINIAHHCDEPLVYARFGNEVQQFRIFLKNILKGKWNYPPIPEQNFKDYMVRIADGFDLCMINTKLPIHNLKIIPGFLYTYIDEKELCPTKEFSVSYLLSLGGGSFWSYRQRQGLNYTLRKDIWDNEKSFKTPTKFYLSYRDKDKYSKDLQNRVMPTDSKKWIFNSQFSISIENIQQEDYLTEKLLGCFISLTVPIYIGCPNVAEYFDPKGMIIVNSLDEVIQAANALTPETYAKMLPYLKENKERTLKLLNLEKEVIAEFRKKLA